MAGEGTKDVTTAEVRTDLQDADTLLLVNSVTKEVQQVPVGDIKGGTAPAYYEDFFGI